MYPAPEATSFDWSERTQIVDSDGPNINSM